MRKSMDAANTMDISVVIPLYNKENSIRTAVEAVLRQTYAVREFIIVDDGSTDGSADIVNKIIKERFWHGDDRIRLISQANSGVSSARNTGIGNAKCEWVAFLDADDIWKDNHIEQIARLHEAFPQASVLSTDYKIVSSAEVQNSNADSEKRKAERIFSNADSFSSKGVSLKEACNGFIVNDFYSRLLYGKHVIWSSTAVVKRTSLLEIGGFDTRMSKGEDLDCWERLYEKEIFAQSNAMTAFYISDPLDGNATRKAGNVQTYAVYLNKAAFRWRSDKDLYRFKVIYGYLKLFISQHQFRNLFLLLVKHNILFLKIPVYILRKRQKGF